MATLKKGGGAARKSQSQLRSPLIKRSPTSAVTLQGWLHKQGSDGLMLWKKRWFVLSDYCLFYYKGPEEEKLLGSFLLASYRISVCSSEDKVYRKYSFKAEHTNMRTYYFAADNQALMAQWINALSLASVLQESWGEANCTKRNMEGEGDRVIGWEPGYQQPVYANAPPKPRRLNEASSPERSPERLARPQEVIARQHDPLGRPHPRAGDVFARHDVITHPIRPHEQMIMRPHEMNPMRQNDIMAPRPQEVGTRYMPERRTPDTYGRNQPPKLTHYEDIYRREIIYRRPKNSFPPRPHSADFLEYDEKTGGGRVSSGGVRPRPKSSMETHWSEEGYARKMRESSLYVTRRPHRQPYPQQLASTLMRNHSEAIHLQERRWSEYLDSRDNNQFVRSASARLPRQQKDDKFDDDVSERSSVTMYKRRNSSDCREGPNKTQQREESMKRLLEWKQRMLQSPLTHKPAGSMQTSAQNELAKYYKHQVLRASPQNQDLHKPQPSRIVKEEPTAYLQLSESPHFNNGNVWTGDETKRKWDDIEGHASPSFYDSKHLMSCQEETNKPRGRSQDGRNSVNRYNSYSSDDEASGSGSVMGRETLPVARQPVVDTPPTLAAPHHKPARLTDLDTPKRLEHLKKLDELRRHLLELEKQYEKGKPLVNLVDNMVKLGSLYRAGSSSGLVPQRLEFNHKVQEQRLLAEEKKDWERISPDHNQLQVKVEQLYRLDRILQEESGTLQSLQQDKEMLERALGGLKHKMQGLHGNPIETERYRRQQRMLEKELTRVRSILAQNSKKLEETVAENARLEQELVVLRQKLQWSRRSAEPGGSATAALEAELLRVQVLVGDLQRQRQELSLQVRQLTEKSHSLSQQIRPGPTGVAGAGAVPGKKRSGSSWLETDLDSQVTHDIGLETPCSSPQQVTPSISPLYVNTEINDKGTQDHHTLDMSGYHDDGSEVITSPPLTHSQQFCRPESNDPNERLKKYYGLLHKEKPQEIKTVRIVKRESERRQRDRDRCGSLGIPLTNTSTKRTTILEESLSPETLEGGVNLANSMNEMQFSINEPKLNQQLTNEPPPTPGPRSDSVIAIKNIVNRQHKFKNENESISPFSTSQEQLFPMAEGSPQLSPVYLSEAARQIVEEVAWRGRVGRRLVPKEKRRHHTVSGQMFCRNNAPYSPGGSRDDLDIERALRPRLNTPDVVRSTLSRTDPKFTTETIDNVLGTPGKILIPERYIPETRPQLSKEELEKRSKKADAIRKMLSETTTIPSSELNDDEEKEENKSSTLKKKVAEEKRQREHLLQLNQILAQQVMEKSKIVAVTALATLPLEAHKPEEEDLSPVDPLPLYQQRENYFS